MKNKNMDLLFCHSRCLMVFVAIMLFLISGVTTVNAASRTFDAGSYIVSADSCWQPNNDPTIVTTGNPAYCDTNKNDQSVFQLFGMLYALLDVGDDPGACLNNDGTTPQQKALFGYCKQIKAYWIIDNTKTSSQSPDLTLTLASASATNPIITIYNSTRTGTVAPMSTYTTKANSGTYTSIAYKGGPFVIDANDITQTEINTLLAKFPSVKIHKSNIPFTGNVDKVLAGKPPKIAVLNEGASDVLEAYIRAAGSFAWRNTVFQYVGARDIIAGCLEDPVPTSCTTKRPDITAPFQLLWAPHWIVESKWGDGSTPTIAEQQDVIGRIRTFLETGNSGFFECASIESMEGSISADGTKSGGVNIGAAGGFTVGSTRTVPRIQTNGGCSDTKTCAADYLKFEETPSWLTQCGGWNYGATGGHVHNMRPNMAKSYNYLTTKLADDTTTTVDDKFVGTQMTRFIHDDSAKLSGSYTPQTGTSDTGYYVYDYLAGGRINGSPTQGYVVYLPGHSYIKCTNSTTYANPPSRTLEFDFNTDPPTASSIYIEVVHTGCTQGSTCPKVNYNLTTGIGTRDVTGGNVDLSAEFATFDSGTNKLSGVIITSSDPNATTDLQITDIYTTFDGNSGAVKLANIVDLTDISSRQSLCAPDLTSTLSPVSSVRCSLAAPASLISLTFSSDISAEASKIVSVKLSYTGGPVTAQYDFVNGGTVATAGNVTLDMRSVVYDAATKTLSNIIIKRGATCADVTLSDIEVTFAGSGTLNLLYNDTTNDEICSPAHISPANCSGVSAPSATAYSINTELYWNSLTPPVDTALKLTYTCSPACTASTITASRTNVVTNADLTLDFKNISASSNKLSNIKLTILDGTKTVTISKVLLTYTGSTSSNKTVSYKNTTNNVTFFSVSTKTNPAEQTVTKTIPKPVLVTPPSTWSYLIGKGICSYYISPYLSSCTIDWGSSNTCGIKYVLNTFLALKYSIVSSNFSKTQPIVKDNILYKASYDYPSYRGHLEMIKVPTLKADGTYTAAATIWDSSTSIPLAGTSGFPSAPLSSTDTTSPRYIFTNLPGDPTHIKFDPVSYAALDSTTKASLKTQLAAGTDNDAIVTINTVRGRKGASTTDVYPNSSSCTGTPDGTIDLYGCAEDSKRLWAIEKSTPALKTKSKLIEASNSDTAIVSGRDRRDRVLFAGGDDGMLHAFYAGTYDSTTDGYPDTASGRGTGKEIWAYIPSSLLSSLKNQPFITDPANEASFLPKVKVDGSPMVDLFFIQTSTSPEVWKRKTRLVSTAVDSSKNEGVVFALDVTDQYTPQLLWEGTYNDTSDTSGCTGTHKNCNMGESSGVAIGSVLLGKQIKNYVFLTSNWKNKKKSDGTICTAATVDTTGCVYGVSAYALEIETGNVVWKRELPYTADATGINVVPAAPALMDKDNNGSYDYVVFGDMQGRIWALKTMDGTNGTTATGNTPAYQVKALGSDGKDASPVVYANSTEPIGASVSVYRDYIVFGTGGADYASDTRDYRVEVLQLKSTGAVKNDDKTIITGGYTYNSAVVHGEKIWAQPVITSDLKVVISTAKSYYSNQTVATQTSFGRILILDLRVLRTSADPYKNVQIVGIAHSATGTPPSTTNDNTVFTGGFVGGVTLDHKQIYGSTLRGDTIQAGPGGTTATTNNPFQILWWRKL